MTGLLAATSRGGHSRGDDGVWRIIARGYRQNQSPLPSSGSRCKSPPRSSAWVRVSTTHAWRGNQAVLWGSPGARVPVQGVLEHGKDTAAAPLMARP